jgi:hypothetical protein
MIKIMFNISIAIALPCPTILASEPALAAWYALNSEQEKVQKVSILETLKLFVVNDSDGYRLKLRMTTEEYRVCYPLIQ